MTSIKLDGHRLTIDEIVSAARKQVEVILTTSAKDAIQLSRSWVEDILEKDESVYGINTGFGIFSEQKIQAIDSARLSRNLVLSHAVATGSPLDEDIVRAAMLVRANTLAKGYSGVRVALIETLLALLNQHVTPVVPSQGSLGSSGDLGPLSHLALVFTTDSEDLEPESGYAIYGGELLSGKEAMTRAGIERIILGAKEGLAISNGATFSAPIGALAVADAETLLSTANVSLAMSLEAVMGCSAAFDHRLHAARGHAGQIRVAEAVRTLTNGSSLLDAHDRVQDPYS